MGVRRVAAAISLVLVVGLLPLAGGGTTAGADPQPPSSDWQLVFEDQFTGTQLDTTKWSIGHENQTWHGGYNTADALTFDGNNMTIDTWTGNGRHNTAVVQGGSNEGGPNLSLATYGFVEARMKFEDEEGMRSSWWLYTPDISSQDSEPLGDPAAAGTEVDMIEHFFSTTDATRKDRFASTLHWDGYQGGHQWVQTPEYNWAGTGRPSLQGNFHNYSVEWTPTEYIFRIDDIETGRLNRAVSHRSLFPILSTELVDMPAGVDYGAKGAARSRVTVDYVRVWQKPIANGVGVVPATWTASTPQDTPTAVPLTVRHVEGKTTTVLVGSSNATLVPNTSIKVSGSGADRTVLVYPAAGQSGTTTLTVTVATAGLPNSVKTIALSVGAGAAPAPPLWNAIPNRESAWGSPTTLPFTLPSSGTVQVASNTDYLVPDDAIAVAGSGTRYALSLTPRPGRTGVADIAVTYGGQTKVFKYTVHSGTFINGDVERPDLGWTYNAGATRLAPAGQNASIAATTGTAVQTVSGLEPNTTYVVGATGLMSGAGSSPVTVSGYGGTPATGSVTFSTTSAVRKWVSFTTGPTSTSATVTVGDNDADTLVADDLYLFRAPMMTALSDRSTAVGTPVSFDVSVGRVGDPLPASALTATSSDTAVVPASGLQFSDGGDPGDAFQRKLTITPAAAGTTNVTVTATDPHGHQASRTFKLTVNAGTFANGGFDYGQSMDQWRFGGQAWLFADNTNQLLRMGPGGYAHQRVSGLTPGQTYELSGRMQAFQGNSQVWMGVRDYGGSPLAAYAAPGGWVENGAAAVRFVATGPAATIYVANTTTATSDNTGQVDGLTLLPVSGGQAAPFAKPGRPVAAIGERSTTENTPALVPFQVSGNPAVTVASSDTTLFPAGSLVLSGSGSDRLLRATPASGKTGTATITLTVGGTASTFPLTVGAGTFRDGGFSEPTATSSWNNADPNVVFDLSGRLVGGGQQRTGDRATRVPAGQLAMNVTLTRGTPYRLEDFVRYTSAGDGGGAWIRVLDGSTVLASTSHSGTASWTAKPLDFTAPGTGTATVTVQFTNWNQTAGLLVDDVLVRRP